MLDPEFHPGSHNLLDETTVAEGGSKLSSPRTGTPRTKPEQGGILDDMSEDLGIPLRPSELKKIFLNVFRS